MKQTSTPLVSVHCATYNHGAFIREALESFVNQKTNFPFRVIVGDDHSRDNTAQIIQEYAESYPEIIVPIYQPKNQGGRLNSIEIYRACGASKYLAFCEGDDFWTDPQKLQKQVDFLEEHPDYSICFHRVREFYDHAPQENHISPTDRQICKILSEGGFCSRTILNNYYLRLNSLMVRRLYKEGIIDYPSPPNIINGDVYLSFMYSLRGKIGFIDQVMSAYRIHSSGIWSGLKDEYQMYSQYGIAMLNCYQALESASPASLKTEARTAVNYHFRRMQAHLIWNSDFPLLRQLQQHFPDAYQYNLRYCLIGTITKNSIHSERKTDIFNYYREFGLVKLLR